MPEISRVDVHQHVWTAPLLEALSARRWLPFVRGSQGLTVLHSAGERPYLIDCEAESPDRRAELVKADGLDAALVAISSPIGIEALPRAEAQNLIDAHLAGVGELGPDFAAWGPLVLDGPKPADVDSLLARGCIGLSLPACALSGPDALDAIRPVLDRVTEHDVPLFVHPGPGTPPGAGEASLSDPLWWRALTDYVAQMQSAWLTFAAFGRREHPHLKILFAMLAGGAPLLSERLEARGGPPIDVRDPLTFYDTSSYGPTAIETMARRVGPDQLVYGSDRPVVEPTLTGREHVLQVNAAQLIGPAAIRSRRRETAVASR
jgi:6-methylsalicylate decarboxylase